MEQQQNGERGDSETKSQSNDQSEFYQAAAKYWDNIPPTLDGMLGGFGFISKTDILGSERFLEQIFKMRTPPQRNHAVDCGAGIGRITKYLLRKKFKKVDLVEQNPKFLEAAKMSLNDDLDQIGNFYPVGLQDFVPDDSKYDIVWCQWVLGHLEDDHLVEFFKRCQKGLRKTGVIVVKENVTSSNKIEIDSEDSSVTRPLSDYERLFKKSGLTCLKTEKQHHFPHGLYPVHMFALRPTRTETKTD